MLAELPDPTSAQSVGWLLLSMAALVVAAERGFKFIAMFKENPPPAETYTTIKECKVLHAALDARLAQTESEMQRGFKELKDSLRDMSAASEDRVSHLHTRINETLASICRIEGGLKRIYPHE